MANHLSSIQNQIVDKNKAEVEALLGKPLKVGHWKNMRPPEGANAAAMATFEATLLDEIWIYSNGRVHFSLAGKALKVDDDVSRDLPPEQETPLIA
jgi:hypothetical protein